MTDKYNVISAHPSDPDKTMFLATGSMYVVIAAPGMGDDESVGSGVMFTGFTPDHSGEHHFIVLPKDVHVVLQIISAATRFFPTEKRDEIIKAMRQILAAEEPQ